MAGFSYDLLREAGAGKQVNTVCSIFSASIKTQELQAVGRATDVL